MVHLAHANGFPPGTYLPLAETLTDRYHVVALPSRPLWPDSQPESAPDWHPLADDLILGLDGLGLSSTLSGMSDLSKGASSASATRWAGC